MSIMTFLVWRICEGRGNVLLSVVISAPRARVDTGKVHGYYLMNE